MGVWVCGCVGVWVCGCVGVSVRRSVRPSVCLSVSVCVCILVLYGGGGVLQPAGNCVARGAQPILRFTSRSIAQEGDDGHCHAKSGMDAGSPYAI